MSSRGSGGGGGGASVEGMNSKPQIGIFSFFGYVWNS